MCGADSRTATVAITVNMVKMMRQNRSTTMAANFQSLIMSASSSLFRMRPVINCSSRRMACSSRVAVPHPGASSRCADDLRKLALTVLGAICACARKSSSMSSTLASRLLDERSFSSNSFILLLIIIVLRVIFFPGRDIPRIQGSHCRNTLFIWKPP